MGLAGRNYEPIAGGLRPSRLKQRRMRRALVPLFRTFVLASDADPRELVLQYAKPCTGFHAMDNNLLRRLCSALADTNPRTSLVDHHSRLGIGILAPSLWRPSAGGWTPDLELLRGRRGQQRAHTIVLGSSMTSSDCMQCR